MASSSCGPNQVFSKGLCQAKCKDGFTGSGPICSKNCPATDQFLNVGPLCQKVPVPRNAGTVPYIETCPNGQIDNGRDCIDKLNCAWPNQCTGTGLPAITFQQRQKCRGAYQELVNGLCYDRCPQGYTGQGDKCMPNCPSGFYEDKQPKGSFCVKPTQGRGTGSIPAQSPLQQIAKSPNGSTLLERYRAGTTVAQQSQAINQYSSFFGSNAGDPANPKIQSNITSTVRQFGSSTQGGLQNLTEGWPNFCPKSQEGVWFGIECLLINAVAYIVIAVAIYFLGGAIISKVLSIVVDSADKAVEGTIKIGTTAIKGAVTGVGQIGTAAVGAAGQVGTEAVRQTGQFVGTGEEALGRVGQGLGVAFGETAQGLGQAVRGSEIGIGSAVQGAQEGIGLGIQGTGSLIQSYSTAASKAVQSGQQLAQAIPQQYIGPTTQPAELPVISQAEIQNLTTGSSAEVPSTGSINAGRKTKGALPSWFLNLSPELQAKLLQEWTS